MTGDTRRATSTIVELDKLLLDAKLSVPQPRPGSVSRAGLIETARTSGCPVVGVVPVPASYGKSTLLFQSALAEDRRVGWVTLDRFDDDPAVLLTLLASAYEGARVLTRSGESTSTVASPSLPTASSPTATPVLSTGS